MIKKFFTRDDLSGVRTTGALFILFGLPSLLLITFGSVNGFAALIIFMPLTGILVLIHIFAWVAWLGSASRRENSDG